MHRKRGDGHTVQLALTRDITDIVHAREGLAERRRELERQVNERTAKLQQTIEQMEEFSYSVSHDLRSPVRAMQGYADVLLEDYADRVDSEGRAIRCRTWPFST